MSGIDVTVVVVTHRGRDLLPGCLDSLDSQTLPHRLLVVDNASTDGTAEYLSDRLPADRVLRGDRNLGFAGGVAAALERVDTRFMALLNDDAVAEPDWLATLRAQATADDPENRATAAWTSVLVDAERPHLVQNAGVGVLATGYGMDLAPGTAATELTDAEVFGFSGGAALLRADAVRAVGGFPAEFFLYYEDTDTSWRLRAGGWRIRRVSAARVAHAHAATSDRRSELFHLHNERNRLWMLIRNAPATVAAGALLRFAVTTGSLAARAGITRRRPDEPNLRVRLRLRVLRAVIAALPRLLRQRRRLARRAALPAHAIWRRWAGTT